MLTRIYVQNELLEIIEETKLLGCVITSDLKFHKNTEYMVKKAYARMTILKKLYSFSVQVEDLKNIYILYINKVLGGTKCSCVKPYNHSGGN